MSDRLGNDILPPEAFDKGNQKRVCPIRARESLRTYPLLLGIKEAGVTYRRGDVAMGGGKRAAVALLCAGLLVGAIVLSGIGVDCVDDFNPDPLGAGVYSDSVSTSECGAGMTYIFTSAGDGGGGKRLVIR